MSMTTLPLGSSTRLMSSLLRCIKPCNNSTPNVTQNFFYNPLSPLPIYRRKNRSLQYQITYGNRVQTDNNSKMDFAIYCISTDNQGDLISFEPMLNSWKAWIIGGLLTVIVPLLTKNRAPLLKWTKNMETTEEKIEEVAEGVEKVGEEVEKVAEDMEEKLPDGGKLKGVVTLVENVAEEAVNDADKVEELINKVENVEKKVDAIIEAEDDKVSAAAKVEKPTT